MEITRNHVMKFHMPALPSDAKIPGAKKKLKFSPGTFQDQLLLLLIHRRFILPDLVSERNG